MSNKYIINCKRLAKPIKPKDTYICNSTGQLFVASSKEDAPSTRSANRSDDFDKVSVTLCNMMTNETVCKVSPDAVKVLKLKEYETFTWEHLDIGFFGQVNKVAKTYLVHIRRTVSDKYY